MYKMKFQYLFLLLSSFIYLSKCQDIAKPTNYTLSHLKNLDMLQMKCTNDNDCPLYFKCESVSISEGKTQKICKFGDFLCPEKIDATVFKNTENDEEYCLYINSTMWDLDKEEIKKGFSKDFKPILKTCSVYESSCSTEQCTTNSDCLSGTCVGHKCINPENYVRDIYHCSTNATLNNGKYDIDCKKVSGMRCGTSSDCRSNRCAPYVIDYDHDDYYYYYGNRVFPSEKDKGKNRSQTFFYCSVDLSEIENKNSTSKLVNLILIILFLLVIMAIPTISFIKFCIASCKDRGY